MNSFVIGDIEFGVGKFDYSVKDNVLNLEVFADNERFNKLCEDDDFEYGWALYAPKIYLMDVPFDGEEIEVNDDLLNECDIALYMMEHNDFWGKITVSDDGIYIEGEVDLMGEIETVSIRLETNLAER